MIQTKYNIFSYVRLRLGVEEELILFLSLLLQFTRYPNVSNYHIVDISMTALLSTVACLNFNLFRANFANVFEGWITLLRSCLHEYAAAYLTRRFCWTGLT